MQRTVLIVLTTAVVAAGIAAGATILLSDNDDLVAASPAPTLKSPSATTEVAAASPAVTGTAGSPPSANMSPGPAPAATSASDRTAASVNCSRQPMYCSDTMGRMEVRDGALEAMSASRSDAESSGVPSVRMTSKILGPDEQEAARGQPVDSLHVNVIVRNGTQKTFAFPKREIVLDIYRDGRLFERLVTKGDGFDMTPGGEMRGKFDQPITRDGNYSWQAKTWYRAK